MSTPQGQQPEADHIMVIGPDGQPVAVPASAVQDDDEGGDSAERLTGLVEQPAKVMRIGRMVQQLLEEVKAAPLDEPGRKRLATVLHTSIKELKDGLAPELDDELDRLIQPFDETPPTESELRIAQAQLVGWLEGLFHGIQTAIYAQQMAARSQLEQMRRALPPGAMPGMHPGQHPDQDDDGSEPGSRAGCTSEREPARGAKVKRSRSVGTGWRGATDTCEASRNLNRVTKGVSDDDDRPGDRGVATPGAARSLPARALDSTIYGVPSLVWPGATGHDYSWPSSVARRP